MIKAGDLEVGKVYAHTFGEDPELSVIVSMTRENDRVSATWLWLGGRLTGEVTIGGFTRVEVQLTLVEIA